MAMIQFPIEDDDLKDLLELTNAKTGTQALRNIISGYQGLMDTNQALNNRCRKLSSENSELTLWADNLSKAMQFFNDYSRN